MRVIALINVLFGAQPSIVTVETISSSDLLRQTLVTQRSTRSSQLGVLGLLDTEDCGFAGV